MQPPMRLQSRGGGLLRESSIRRQHQSKEKEKDEENIEELMQFDYLAKGGEPCPKEAKVPYDIVLAADCIYLEAAFDPLVSTLVDICGENTEVIIAYKKRRKADKRFFKKLMKYFVVSEIKDDPNYAEFSKKSLYLYSAKLKQKKSHQ
ncbi:hypothetical protein HK098_007969 [Nowakowskiella sp. JEL0407]|nr:hypothetical protein HK098_007969 [Nowakowskiella sp. JEL0407]